MKAAPNERKPVAIPRELSKAIEDMTIEHEVTIRGQEGNLPRPVLHASLVGYYTGVLHLLTLAGYGRSDDPTIDTLIALRDLHGRFEWPEDSLPKGDPPP